MGYYRYMSRYADILILAGVTLVAEVALIIAIYPYL
jgi:hypothetical protein